MNTAKIVAVTRPLIEGIETTEDFMAYCAKVSNPSNQFNTLTTNKLLKYLAKNGHWSPFEMVSITMQLDTTRDIARQVLRHRSFSFQEFSQRYADPTKDLGFERREARLQDTKNRQNSIETDDDDLHSDWNDIQDDMILAAVSAYKWAISKGIAKEVARAVLPEGLTSSRLYMSGTVRSWIHYCQLRTDRAMTSQGEKITGTQKEHKELAQACWDCVIKEMPSLSEILDYNQ